MTRIGGQKKLFDSGEWLSNGLVYKPDFVSEAEEEVLLAYIENLPLREARFKEYRSKRRVINFGWGYDFDKNRFIPGPPLPQFLFLLQRKIAKWLGISSKRVAEALVTEYTEGTGVGFHRDSEAFEHIIGISLGGWCHLRLRPLSDSTNKKKVLTLELEPRSAYIMQGEVRFNWQHSIAPTKTKRYSITFRTLPQ